MPDKPSANLAWPFLCYDGGMRFLLSLTLGLNYICIDPPWNLLFLVLGAGTRWAALNGRGLLRDKGATEPTQLYPIRSGRGDLT